MGRSARTNDFSRLLVIGALLAGLFILIHSCTVSRAQGDSAPAAGPQGDSGGKAAPPAAPGHAVSTPESPDNPEKANADSAGQPAAPVGPEAPGHKARHGAHGKPATDGAAAAPAAPSNTDDDSADDSDSEDATKGDGQPTAATPAHSEAGQQGSGFSELEKGWPAGAADDASDDDGAAQQTPPSMQLTDEARGFAGRWVAAVINRDGQAHLLDSENEWTFNLGLDARCSAHQELDGRGWDQSGWWQLQGDTLTLSLGPGGVQVFGLQQQGADMAVWSRAAEDEHGPKLTLFCVRTPAGKMPPGVASAYNSDFGPLRFQPSGPGHWRASYGDPLGKLTVARVGGFLAGRWEQQPGVGFALFRLDASGNSGAASNLDGVWWYASSTGFDGAWKATTAK